MTSYGIPHDQVPMDGYPYIADLCPTCLVVRPFRIEDDDDGQGWATCATCGHAYEYDGMDSPGTSPEADDDDDEPTDDAAVWRADGTGEEDEQVTGVCPECGPDACFVELDDEEIEGEPDPSWTYWACTRCGAYPEGEVMRPIDRLPEYHP